MVRNCKTCDAGNTHFGNSIPDKSRKAGKTLDVPVRKPSISERQKAEAVAESIRQAAEWARKWRFEQRERIDAGAEQPDQTINPDTLTKPSPPN
ncbi:MAG TPA: hypothetical protein ENH62_14200 [Marinobacter sp.]|uniref:Uncharacterized protein n=2 Tax=root TaxID=1 RepID=A0A831W2T9_9GAMM|nr:hypothetical protein [Marinobacter antarcticus]HDZ39403.1 hypothetical protein [Marinobacter sp.]HEA53537.1 hypothetical protein [Marinobacter antarcticus]